MSLDYRNIHLTTLLAIGPLRSNLEDIFVFIGSRKRVKENKAKANGKG